MQKVAELGDSRGIRSSFSESNEGRMKSAAQSVLLPISVIVPVRSEAQNLARCLESLRGVGEIWVVDAQSADGTVESANACGAQSVRFQYQGRRPKKRQWPLDALPPG